MTDFAILLIALVGISLLTGLVYARRQPPRAPLHAQGPRDYAVILWAQRSGDPGPVATTGPLQPHKIKVEYRVRIQADTPAQLSAECNRYARAASADFHQRFAGALTPCDIGAVRFDLLSPEMSGQ